MMETHYYLFSPGFKVIMVRGNEDEWYERDRCKHIWIRRDTWSVLFYAIEYAVIEIDYDEKREKILSRRKIPGFSSSTDQVLFDFEKD